MAELDYHCTQQELYTANEIGWASNLEDLPDFTNNNTNFTVANNTAMVAAGKAAEALPDAEVRKEAVTTGEIKLQESAVKNRANWQSLKTRITTGNTFPESLHEALVINAGAAHYPAAADDNWDAVKNLLNDGQAFFVNHMAELTAGGMPAGIPVQFADDAKDFNEVRLTFIAAKKSVKDGAAEKVNANNAVYSNLIEMFEIGQDIFKNNEQKRKNYIFSEVLAQIRGSKPAGLKGTITDSVTLLPLAGVNVATVTDGYVTVSDEFGKFNFSQLAAGTYEFIFTKAGYTPFSLILEIKTSVTSTKNIQMVAL
jgi:hypothetical protein